MSGWTIALGAGGVLILLIGGLCFVVLRAVSATAETTQELGRVLAQVQANTAALAKLDQATSTISGAARQLTSRLEELPEVDPDATAPTPNGRTRSAGTGRRTPRR